MPEVDKKICFSALHILAITIMINLFTNNNISYIIESLNYIINLDSPGLWFLIIHTILLSFILSCLQFELGFYAAINFI
jgi:hypothetical protein